MIKDYSNGLNEGEAFVLLNKEITPENSLLITDEIYRLHSEGKHVTLKINSTGGSVLAGYNIIDALISTNSDTHIIGIAASMAGVIAQFGAKRYANDNAIGMIHPPTGNNNEVVDMVRVSLKKALTNKSKLTESEITSYLSEGGEDNFFDSSQLLEKGLIDKIFATNQKIDTSKINNKQDYYEVFNNIINNEEMSVTVENQLKEIEAKNTLLEDKNKNLSKENTEVKNSIKDLTVENESLKLELENFKKAKELETENRAKDFVKNLIEGGKLKQEDSEKWEKMAIENLDMFTSIVNEIKVPDLAIENFFENGEGKKNFEEMNASEKADFARKNPDAYNKMILNKYK
jgi:ATP-dependent protease ClpP protease subunit